MRQFGIALVVLATVGCEEPTLQLSASISQIMFSADPAQPDGLASVDLTIDVETVNEPADVTLSRTTAFALPRDDDDAGIGFTSNLMNPQGAGDPVLRLEANAMLTVRVTNADLTNAAVADLCGRPAAVDVEFSGGGLTAEDSAEVTVLCN